MPFTTIGFAEDIATTAAFANILGVPDQHITVIANRFYVGDLNNVVGVGACLDADALGAYLDAPSLRRVALYDISPINLGIIPAALTVLWFPTNPLPLMKNEGLEFLFNGAPAGATQKTAVVMLSDGPIVPVGGEIFSVAADAAITTVAGVWGNGGLVFRQILPVGRYQIVGASCISVNGVAFRFVPIGAANRPGGFCKAAVGDAEYDFQRKGQLGVWCEFDSVTPPSIDMLCSDVDVAQQLILDLVKVA